MAKRQTDKDRIANGKWANCWICETVFRRKRETKRYCSECNLRGRTRQLRFSQGHLHHLWSAQRRPLK
jgi:hypothetical protein